MYCVLLVEDRSADVELIRRALANSRAADFRIEHVDQLSDAVDRLAQGGIDVVLLDLTLPDEDGIDTFRTVYAAAPTIPIVVLTGLNDEQLALETLQLGAQDYLVKGEADSKLIIRSLRYAIERSRADNLHQLNCELEQARQSLIGAKELLEKKNRRLSDLYETAHRFVDNVSHEFRTPLTVIKEYASLVRDGLVESVEEQHRFLDIVADRADDLNTMVDDMLDVSKLGAGLLGAWRKNCHVFDIVEQIRPGLERKAAVKGVLLDADVDRSLPAVYCDAEKIGRVLINLTVNAIKFCQPAGQVRIWVKEHPTAASLIVGVTDNGVGIDPQSLSRIFERFQQAENNLRNNSKGFGLGLNIAKELVDLNFGEMDVTSTVGQGSTFTFTLPLADPLEVMQRYLQRVVHLRNGSTKVSLLSARIAASTDDGEADDVEAYLNGLLRRNDLIFRVGSRAWVLVLACSEIELDKFYERARSSLLEINRNRIHGALPAADLRTVGTWRAATEFKEVLAQMHAFFESEESVYA